MIPVAGRRLESLPARVSSAHSTSMSRKCDCPLVSVYRLWMRMSTPRHVVGKFGQWHWGKLRARSTQPSPRAAPSPRTATRERAGSPRRTWVYVEGCRPARNEVWRSKLTQCRLPGRGGTTTLTPDGGSADPDHGGDGQGRRAPR